MQRFRIKDLMVNVLPEYGHPAGQQLMGNPAACGSEATLCQASICAGTHNPAGCLNNCSFACTFQCTAACTFACTAACTFVCSYACTAACTNACTGCSNACTHACTYACSGYCTGACTYICTAPCTFQCSQVCTVVCTACSYNATQQPCGLSNNPCGGFSGHFCAGTFAPDDLRRLDPEVLAVLKIQLRAALEKVDEADRAQAEQLRPQTLQEAESLENKLSAALAEVKEWHAELKARDAGKKPSK